MIAGKRPERYYRLLYFSPRPEDQEQVCVGVLMSDSGRAYLDYDEKLEKVHCFAPDYAKDSIAFAIRSIEENAEDAAELGRIPEFSPQFRLSEPRALFLPVDHKLRSVLRQRYLLKMRSPERRRRERGLGKKIDRFLAENLDLPFGFVRRRATAADVLGHETAKSLPHDLVPRAVSRAVLFDSRACLIDGVDLHSDSSDLVVSRVNRVAPPLDPPPARKGRR